MIRHYMPGKVIKIEILKNEAQRESGIFSQNLDFRGEIFSNISTKFFYGLYENFQGIQKICLTWILALIFALMKKS